MTRPARTWRGRTLAALCILYLLGAIAFWATIRYLGDRWWPATVLLYAPRWPWLLPLFVLLPLCHRRRKLLWIPIITGLFVLGPLMGFSLPWRRAFTSEPTGPSMRLLVCNVHRLELNLPALDAYITASNPQVVLLQDFSGRDASPVLSQAGWNRYQLGEIFLASRFPIGRVQDLHLQRIKGEDDLDQARRTGSAVCFDLRTPAGIVHLVNLHLASPHTALRTFRKDPGQAMWRLKTDSIRRYKESEQISQWLATQSGPVIIAGDFNTPAESPIYRRFWSEYADAFPTAGFGFGYTHFSSLSELRIDHLLTGPGITCTHFQIGPPCGTPHRPMRADLVFSQ